ncbi:MAG: hypothetical protein V4864_21800 [Pseudomonadota bacterium]
MTSPALTMDDPGFGRAAAVLLGAGALGVLATSACYVLAGPLAAMPGGAADMQAARAATGAAAGWMRAAGLFGMPADVLLAAGALMMAATRRGPGAATAVGGWLALGIASVLFIVVDAMVSFVLPAVAAAGSDPAAYAGLRALFDVLFAIGGWTAGAGALAAAWSAHWPEYRRAHVLWLMRAAGVLGLAANTAWLLGLPAERLIGPGVVLLCAATIALALALAISPRPRTASKSMPTGSSR